MRTLLLSAAALSLAACGGEVTDGGTGSDTDFDEVEAMQGEGPAEATEIAANEAGAVPTGQPRQEGLEQAVRPDDPRAGDYPEPGEEQTRNPIESGNEEPGGKDMVLAEEYEAMGIEAPSAQRAPLEAARREARGPVALYQDKLYLSRGGVSLAQLGREPVPSAMGDAFTVENVLLAANGGRLVGFVLREEGTLGVPGETVLVDAADLTLSRDEGRGRTLALRRGDGLPAYDEDALPTDTVLASNLLREAVRVGGSNRAAAIEDVVMREDGTLYGFALSLGGERYLIEPGQLVLAQGDGGYEVTLSVEELRAKPFYVGVPAYEQD